MVNYLLFIALVFYLIFLFRAFEKTINEKMMYRDYVLPEDQIVKYIDEVNQVSFSDYVSYALENLPVSYLTAEDVIQFSSFTDATVKVCSVIKAAGDQGYTSLEVGKLLEDDGQIRKDGAYVKYGENHAKTAEQLGLLHKMSGTYFLSCLGACISDLPEEKRINLLCRLILRNKLIRRLIKRAEDGNSNYWNEVGFLGDSTANRRKSNVKTVVSFLINNTEMSSVLKEISFSKPQ